jgi:hypothetical protein
MAGRIHRATALPTAAKAPLTWPLLQALRLRLSGPGGLYNLGNAFGLATGLALHVAALGDGAFGSGSAAQWSAAGWSYFAGGPAALCLTVSMVVFYVSGEAYHRAFAGPAPDFQKLRAGDLLSGHGAIMLGIGLLFLGQPALAATAGALHALGKYGSAGVLFVARWPALCRQAVVFSRLPALAATLLALARAWEASPLLSVAVLTPLTLLVCYALWLAADWLLLRPARSG